MTANFYIEQIGYEVEIDFEGLTVKIKNGSPKLIKEAEAVRQWIVKFAMTPKDVYPIYEGTGFGTRMKELFGRKRIGYGYEETELERDYREGLLLCPAISQVTDFKLKKEGKHLKIDLAVELYNGETLDLTIEKAYTFKI